MLADDQPDQSIVRRLQDLLSFPRENMDEELKGWLDLSQEESKANLAQAILALANYGGGYVIIGYMRDGGNWVPARPRPIDLSGFTQDIVNGIVRAYAEPAFHCGVYHLANQSDEVFPIIVVPGAQKVPIRAKRSGPNERHVRMNVYYTRRPGPTSESIQTSEEWNVLINRCIRNARETLLDDFRSVLWGTSIPAVPQEEGNEKRLNTWIQESTDRFQSLIKEQLPNERPSRYSHGTWIVAYSIIGEFEPITRVDLLGLLAKIEGHETGWPPWLTHLNVACPYPFDSVIECWIKDVAFQSAEHSDFWRASPLGMMYLLRGYQEDSTRDFPAGTVLDLILPIWRIGECLLHAERFANQIGDQVSLVRFKMVWSGLEGRHLKPWASRRLLFDDRMSVQKSVCSEIEVSARKISTTLPEIVDHLTQPLYEVFDFFKAPMQMIREELSEMSKLKF